MTRVVLLSSHALFRAALAALLRAENGVEVLAEVSDLDAAVAEVARRQPDVVLAVTSLESDNWWNLLTQLAVASSSSRVVLLTPLGDTIDAASAAFAIERGAHGVISSEESAGLLIKALHKVRAGEVWLERSGVAALVEQRRRRVMSPEQEKIARLTRREREIITWVGKGLKNLDVAGRLGITEATVRNHLTSILDKLELHDRFELALFGLREGLVTCPACRYTHRSPGTPAGDADTLGHRPFRGATLESGRRSLA